MKTYFLNIDGVPTRVQASWMQIENFQVTFFIDDNIVRIYDMNKVNLYFDDLSYD
jgi:hypothetical protein